MIDDSLGDEVRVTVIAAGFEAGSASRKPATSISGAAAAIASARAGAVNQAVTSSVFEPDAAASVPHTNGATVRVGGGGDDGGISDDDVDVPPFMRH